MGESAIFGVAVKTVSATEIKNRFGQYLARAAVEPVAVEKNGRPVAVLLSFEEYESVSYTHLTLPTKRIV